MQSQESDLARCRYPVDEGQRERLPAVRMVEFVRKDDKTGGIFWEFCCVCVGVLARQTEMSKMYTFSKFFDAYVRKFLNLLDEQILLVALKNQCCAALTTTLKAKF